MLKIFIIRDKKLLIYLITTHKLNLNLFIDQNMMKGKRTEDTNANYKKREFSQMLQAFV